MRFLSKLLPIYPAYRDKWHIYLGWLLCSRDSYYCMFNLLLVSFNLIWRLLKWIFRTWANIRVSAVVWFIRHCSSNCTLFRDCGNLAPLQWHSSQSFRFSLIAAVEFYDIWDQRPGLSLISNLLLFIFYTWVNKNSIF